MPVAARQCVATLTDDWVTVEEAAALTGESIRAWQHKAALEAKSARQQSRASLAVKRRPDAGDGKAVWHVRRSLDPRLTRTPSRDQREDRQRQALIVKHPQHKVEEAYQKARWLTQWRRLCETRRGDGLTEAELADRIIVEARRTEGDDRPISFRALQLWRRAYYAKGPDGQIRGVEGLIDRRGSEPVSGADPTGRDPAAEEYFYSVYHCQNRLTVLTCHDLTLRKARKESWAWPKSYSATRKWLQTHDDLALTCLLREGRDVWQRRYMPHLNIDHTLIAPGQLFVCDHHQCDFWVEHDGRQLRPWLTAIQDDRSRAIVGWHLGIAAHQDSILAAMRPAFLRWAIPEHMRIDNGRDFTSKLLTGVTKHTRDVLRAEYGADWRRMLQRDADLVECSDAAFGGVVHELGIELIYAIPYAPWSKGTLERWFGTFEDHCGKSFATYCGNSALRRPECLEAIRRGYTKDQKRALRRQHGKEWKRIAVLKFVDQSAVPTLQQAREAVGESIEIYHRSEHRGDGMNGQTPLAVWNTAGTLRRASEDELLFLMQARGLYTVGPNGVRFKVGNQTLTYGGSEPKLYPLRGREVFITLDPADLSQCYAWNADRQRFIARLQSNERISPLTAIDDLRDAVASMERRRKIGRKADREAPARTRSVAQELSAQRRERLGELRATGTDGRMRPVTVTPVRTGFEGASKPIRTAIETVPVDRRARDLSAVAEALRFNPRAAEPVNERSRATLDALLSRPFIDDGSPEDDGDREQGKDADSPRADLFGPLSERRHERTDG